MTLRAHSATGVLPLSLNVSRDGVGGETGLACTVSVRVASTVNQFLDFSDATFKTSGWTMKEVALSEVGGGEYVSTALNVAAVTNLPAVPTTLVAQYKITTPGSEATANETIQVDDDLADIAANLVSVLRINQNKLRVNFTLQRLELFDDAGVSVIKYWPLTTNGGEPVATSTGVQTVRGVPT